MPKQPRFVDTYLPYLMIQAAYRMSAGFHHVLSESDVRESEWRVLATMSGSQGMRMSELVGHVLIVQSTLSRTINRMARKFLIMREPDPDDGRAQILMLSDKGQRLADVLIAAAKAHQDADLAHLDPDQREALTNTLSTLFPALGFADVEREGSDAPFRMNVRAK